MIRFLLILALSTSSSAPAPSDIPVSLGQARSGTLSGDAGDTTLTTVGPGPLEVAAARRPTGLLLFRGASGPVYPGGSAPPVLDQRVAAGSTPASGRSGVPASPSKPAELPAGTPGVRVAMTQAGPRPSGVRVTRHNAPQGRNAPRSASKRPEVVSEGVASWFCEPGRSPCTRGYPSEGMYAAAGPGLRVGNWRGSFVTFCTVTRYPVIPSCREVQLVDFCRCPNRLVDLYASVWHELGVGLWRGTVTVSVGLPKWWQRAFAGAMATEGA